MSAEIPAALLDYFAQRAAARQAAVDELLAGLTERERGLVHDAAVMGYVRGSLHAHGHDMPSDTGVVADVVNACLHLPHLYPTLTGYVPDPLCTECGHELDEHEEGDDPVSPGTCLACDDEDDAVHDFQPPEGPRP